KSVMMKHTNTVAVSTPLKAMPVPGVERIEGFTTTMYDIVKKVVMPAMASVRRLGLGSETVVIVWLVNTGAKCEFQPGISRSNAGQNKARPRRMAQLDEFLQIRPPRLNHSSRLLIDLFANLHG